MKTKLQIMILTLAIVFLSPSLLNAAQIAVVDSGTDFNHEDLQGKDFRNPREIPGNRVDDDQNGKVDDVSGWNFIDGYHRVFFREHLSSYDPIIYKLFEIIAKQQSGTATEADKQFWNDHAAGLPDAEKAALLAQLNHFGQYSHGTHVSGIVAMESPDAKILAARVFGDDQPPEYDHNRPLAFADKKRSWSWTSWVYKVIAFVSSGMFDQASMYVSEMQADVANYSLGVPLQMFAKALLAAKGIKDPTPEQLAEETQRAMLEYEPRGRKWLAASPKTLFVIAAGNDGTDNDSLPIFPANITAPNSIRVAATQGSMKLASFSNFGKTSVDIAAPGVAIWSSVPSLDNKTRLPLSGTSMAAPFVAGVAGKIKDLNPSLTPEDIKAILMGTVDAKPWLKEKVISGGLINPARAYAAAKSSVAMGVTAAIQAANSEVPEANFDAVFAAQGFSESESSPESLKEAAARLVF